MICIFLEMDCVLICCFLDHLNHFKPILFLLGCIGGEGLREAPVTGCNLEGFSFEMLKENVED